MWADLNADGVQQSTERGVPGATVTLYNGSGATVASVNTTSDGQFMFERLRAGAYSLGVSNVPLGLRAPTTDPLTSRLAAVTLRTGQRLSSLDVGLVDALSPTRPGNSLESALPTPSLDQLNSPVGSAGSVLAAVVIMLIAGLLAASVLFSSAQPIRVRRLTSR